MAESRPTDFQYRSRTQAILRQARAEERTAVAIESVAEQMRVANMLTAAGFSTNAFHTNTSWARALHKKALELIGVKP